MLSLVVEAAREGKVQHPTSLKLNGIPKRLLFIAKTKTCSCQPSAIVPSNFSYIHTMYLIPMYIISFTGSLYTFKLLLKTVLKKKHPQRMFEESPKDIFIMSSFDFQSVGISLDYSIISSKKCVKTTCRHYVHEVMQFSVMVIKERLKQQRKTTKQFRGREVCIFVHTLRSTIH